jgi:sugar phosphate isomerase/epimerase
MNSTPDSMKKIIKNALRAIAVLAFLIISPAILQAEVSLMVYDFNLGPDPARNVDYVKSLGFSGLATSVSSPGHITKLQDYASHVLTLEDFQLLAFVNYDFDNPASPQVWRDALPILAMVDAPLWVIVKNAPTSFAVRDLLSEMARQSQRLGVRTIIYPHWNTSIETAAEAAVYMAQVAHPNLSNSLHTCHEIRGGNQYSMEAVVAAHADDSSLVAIAGAEENAYAGPPPGGSLPWDDCIKPLDEGDYSLLPFLQALQDAGYSGPVILQTFGITDNPGHLQRSIRTYARYRKNLTGGGG